MKIDVSRSGSRLDRLIDVTIAGGLAVLILVGFATSYRTLRDLAATVGGYPSWLAPAVPLSFDLGIVVLSLKVTKAAREGRTAPILRLVVAALSAATVIANAAAVASLPARLLHGVPPAMFVICFESVVVTARRNALRNMHLLPDALPRLRTARWLLAPRSSWTVWRELVLGSGTDHALSSRFDTSAPNDQDSTVVRGDAARPAVNLNGSPKPVGRVPLEGAAEREHLVGELISAEPSLTAPRLAMRLRAKGYPVSTRTAQRLRSRALHERRSSGVA